MINEKILNDVFFTHDHEMLLIAPADAPLVAERIVNSGKRLLGAEGFIYDYDDKSIKPLMNCVIDFSNKPANKETVDEFNLFLKNNDFKMSNVVEFVVE